MALLTAISLVFGGCCSNLFFLEKLIRVQKDAGDLITFAQFLTVSIEGLVYFAVVERRLPRPRRWIIPAALYFAINVLNNKVWAFNVSVQMHSIFRSSNALVVMLVGLAVGKKYSTHQMLAVVLMTLAVIWAVLGKPNEGSPLGFLMLAVASVLNAIQSLYTETITCSAREMTLMLHLCSLPFFAIFHNQIRNEWLELRDFQSLVGNCFTQWLCTIGVNQLMSAGALTTNVVLTLRKFTSMLLSAYFFGDFSYTLLASGILIFISAIYYAKASRDFSLQKSKTKQD